MYRLNNFLRLSGGMYRTKLFILGILVTATLVSMSALLVGAIGKTGPQPDISNEADGPRYVLVNSPNTDALDDMQLPVYFKDKPTSDVTIQVKNIVCYNRDACTGGGLTNQYIEMTADRSPLKRFNATYDYKLDKDAFAAPRSSGNQSNRYRAVIKIQLRNGNNGNNPTKSFRNRIAFRIDVDAPSGGDIGNAVGGGRSYVNLIANKPEQGQKNPNGSKVKYNYSIPMATPCYATPGKKVIELTDLDSNLADNEHNVVSVNVKGVGTKILPGDVVVLQEGMGSGETHKIEVNFKKNGKYKLNITSISPINMVQYRFPYDDINFDYDCGWTLSGSTTGPAAYARPDATVKFTHRVANAGPDDAFGLRIVAEGRKYTASNNTWSSPVDSNWPSNTYDVSDATVNRGQVREFTTSKALSGYANGDKYCERVVYNYKKDDDSSYTRESEKCVTVRYEWKVGATSLVKLGTGTTGQFNPIVEAKPGENVTFRHVIKNNGTDSTTALSKAKASTIWGLAPTPNNPFFSLKSGGASGATATGHWTPTRKISQDDVADGPTQYCQNITVSPSSYAANANSAGTGSVTSAAACVRVPYNYNLSTEMKNPDNNKVVVAGQSETPTGNVINAGPTKSRTTTHWEFTTMKVPKDKAVPTGSGVDGRYPCAFYKTTSPDAICVANKSSQESIPASSGVLKSGDSFQIPNDTAVGARVCFALSVRNNTQATSPESWYHSAPTCVTVGKKPNMQVWGGDLLSQGVINMSYTNSQTGGRQATFGSWGEYGVFSKQTITNAASASGLSEGADSAQQASWSRLTFANRSIPFGRFSAIMNTNLASQFSTPGAASAIGADTNVAGLASGTYKPGAGVAADIKLGGKVGAGKDIIIDATGRKVIITEDLLYGSSPTDRYGSVADIPQLVIIAKNIQINSGVGEVNAWLIAAGGTIDTCGDVGVFGAMPANGTILKSDVCDKQLKVHGPVSTSRLTLKRTHGASGVDPGVPAEIFNLRSDAYLWAYNRSTGSSQARTTYVTELPPRF